MIGHDSLKTRRTLTVGDAQYDYFSVAAAAETQGFDAAKLPFSTAFVERQVM